MGPIGMKCTDCSDKKDMKFLLIPAAVSLGVTAYFRLDGPMLLYGFASGMIFSLFMFPEEAKMDEFKATTLATAPQLAVGTAAGYFLARR